MTSSDIETPDHDDDRKQDQDRKSLGTLVAKGRRLVTMLLKGDDVNAHTQRMAALTFIIRVASAAILYLMQVVLARLMGANEFGIFAYIWTWVVILGLVTCLGFNVSVKRFMTEYMTRNDMDMTRGLLRGMYGSVFLFSSAVAILGIAGVHLFSDWIASYYVIPFYLGLVCIPLFAITDVQEGQAISRSRIVLGLVPPYIIRPSLILIFMIALMLAGFPATATTALTGAIGASWLAGLLQTALLYKKTRAEIPSGPRTYNMRKWLAVSLPLFVVEGFYVLATHADILVLSTFVSPDQIAIYYASIKTMALVAFVHYALEQVSARRFTEFFTTENHEGLREFYSETIKWTFWPSLLAALGIIGIGKVVLWFFGPEFMAGYPIILVLAISLLIQSAAGPVGPLLSMTGNERLTLWASGSAMVVNIALNFMLIPYFGLIGAAIATATGSIVQTAVLAHFAHKQFGVNLLIWQRSLKTGKP